MKGSSKYLVLAIPLFLSFPFFGQDIDSYDSNIKSYLNALTDQDFSGTILVANNHEILESRAYGLANREFHVKNSMDTRFNIASITKTFTAVAILQLYDQGKLELNKPIGYYIEDYPNTVVRDSVTIHQLLTHTGGTRPFYQDRFLNTDKLRLKNVKDFVPLFVKDTLLFTPGSKYHYNGSGFVILGLIIEKISGQEYYEYLRNNIFSKANMMNTLAIALDSIVPNKASGCSHRLKENSSLSPNTYYLAKASPAGGHYSTVNDLFKFWKALKSHVLLTKETTKLMFEPKVKGYNTHLGYGIDIDLRYNQPIIGQSGGWFGVRCELMDFTKSDYVIILLSNLDDYQRSGVTMVSDFFKRLIAEKE